MTKQNFRMWLFFFIFAGIMAFVMNLGTLSIKTIKNNDGVQVYTKSETKPAIKFKKIMKHEFKVTVYPADTDTYGVVWHGAYIKWLERGRIELFEQMGIKFLEMDEMGIVMPVVNINLQYKKFGKPYDEISIESQVIKTGKTSITFYQEIKNIKTDEILVTADVTGVTTNREGKLYRTIPEYIQEKYKEYNEAESGCRL